jgi:hypothetical protein
MGSNQSPGKRIEGKQSATPASIPSILSILAIFIALLAGALFLFHTNPRTGTWPQRYDPAGNWLLSTLLAALPVIVLLGAMAILRIKAHLAAFIGLAAALAVVSARRSGMW